MEKLIAKDCAFFRVKKHMACYPIVLKYIDKVLPSHLKNGVSVHIGLDGDDFIEDKISIRIKKQIGSTQSITFNKY